MNNIETGGVPEHFNWPWHALLESRALASSGIGATWRDFPGGSGAMAEALQDGGLDVAMLLTEAAVTGIARGGTYRIVSLFTESPLIWGIHVPAGSQLREARDTEGARYAISRHGSGSHLMGFVHARRQGWPAKDLVFVTVGSLEGAVRAFEAGTADVFLWEKLMTKPVVDTGLFRRIGELVAPWPAFVVCASERALAEKPQLLSIVLRRVFQTADEVSRDPRSAARIARRYGLDEPDVVEWLQHTQWAGDARPPREIVATVAATLEELSLIRPGFDASVACRELR